jgi:hypothetical protein
MSCSAPLVSITITVVVIVMRVLPPRNAAAPAVVMEVAGAGRRRAAGSWVEQCNALPGHEMHSNSPFGLLSTTARAAHPQPLTHQ